MSPGDWMSSGPPEASCLPAPDAPSALILDAVARVAVRVLDVQLVMISFADDAGRWLQSAAGPLAGAGQGGCLTSFCDEVLRHPGSPLIVQDASLDPRFKTDRLVTGPPGIRFYAGVPFRHENGEVLGLLCAIDTRPRRLAPPQHQTLLDLAVSVGAALVLRQGAQDHLHARRLNPHCPWIADVGGKVLEMSPQVTEMTGMPVAGSLGDGWIGFVHPDETLDVQARWAMSLRTGERYDVEYRIRQADATYRWFHVHASPRCSADGEISRWYGIIEDIDDRRSSSARTEHLAYHDGLTGLPNRAQFRRLLEQQIARVERGASFALLRLDLDDFKAINDTLGYVSGDALLMEVAARLAGSMRHTDILARSGNDEFFILQTDLGQPDDAALLADRILMVLTAPIRLDGTLLGIGASIGITLCPQDGAIIDKLLQNSDLALERAKQDARGGYRFFEPDMDERLRLRQALKLELRDALDRDELELAYQPLIGLPGGRIHGFEALLRWRHPVRGFVSPAEFIPTAEKTGLILPIGRWVLERACRDAAGWPGDIRVAVNLSTVQFRQQDLVETVAAALALSGLDPQRLELEITESVSLLDDDANLATLHRLRGLGVRIVLDDFGTGYASLGYLARFAFDKLKIDRSFVARMTDTPDTQTIVNAVLRMSQALGIATTAEGVETREQLDILLRAGCDELQGFFFSHPVPLSMVPGVIARHDARRRRERWFDTAEATGTGG